MQDPILSLIRAATAEAHERIEREMDIESAVSDPACYGEILSGFLACYEPIERRLQEIPGWGDFGIDPAARSKTSKLESDLLALDIDPGGIQRIAPPDFLDDLSSGFGASYVLEGSTLGGQQISKMLEGSSIPHSARSFFAGYGGDTVSRWKDFCAAIQRFHASGGNGEKIVTGAIATFDVLRRRICPTPVRA